MPSLPSPPRPRGPERAPGTGALPAAGGEAGGGRTAIRVVRRLSLVLALAATFAACASAPQAPAPAPTVDSADRPYLLPPGEGYAARVDAAAADRLQEAFETRILRGDAAGAAAAAEAELAVDAALPPARVLLGQSLLIARELERARETLAPVVTSAPGYGAAGLALARVHELMGDVPAAYAIYRRLAAAYPVALERSGAAHGRAVEIVAQRLQEALRRNHLDDARSQLGLLREWAPGERSTLESALAVGRAANDPREELVAVRALASAGSPDPALVERRGELELQVGDPAIAIDIYTGLARANPQEPRWSEALELAKFRWRASHLPGEVRQLLDKPELLRGDYAVLLYWLVPGVRAGVASSARIATDVLDHPQRQEIVRVVNLQLMEVDDALRRFEPANRVRRVQALRALLRVLQRAPAPPSCVTSLAGNPSPSREALCGAAAACGYLPEAADCLPEAGVSGVEAADWIRRTQSLLGGS
jgi:tetratricopeptide (TPR) repeat protein